MPRRPEVLEHLDGSAWPRRSAPESHVFGLGLSNDWSARNFQSWEYQPLGPFLSKNFASTVSPWIVTMEALAPYRVAWNRPAADPQPLPYLDSAGARAGGAFGIELEVLLQTQPMRDAGVAPTRLSTSDFRDSYWTVAQMVAHPAVNGCNLQPGDLLGSGTQSGPEPEQAGSLIELCLNGRQPLTLPNGERRSFLEDGDSVVLRGTCRRAGRARVRFGECVGTLLPARPATDRPVERPRAAPAPDSVEHPHDDSASTTRRAFRGRCPALDRRTASLGQIAGVPSTRSAASESSFPSTERCIT